MTDTITEAARMLREHAERAMPAMRWESDGVTVTAGGPDGSRVATADADDPQQAGWDLAYIALVDPAVGRAIATLMTRCARTTDNAVRAAALDLATELAAGRVLAE